MDDGKNDKSSLNDLLENADIRFEMYEVETEIPHILNGECHLTTRTKKYDNCWSNISKFKKCIFS